MYYDVAYKDIVVAGNVVLEWFSLYLFMQANPVTFQFIVFENKSHQRDIIKKVLLLLNQVKGHEAYKKIIIDENDPLSE